MWWSRRRGADQKLDRGRRIGIGHEPLADQERAVAGRRQPLQVGPRLQSALAHRHDAVRHLRRQPVGRRDVHLQRAQIAVVDADHAGAAADGARQLLAVVHLDQRRQPQLPGTRLQRLERRLIERGDDQQHGVGPRGTRLEQLVLVHHEVLAQQRHVHGRAHGLQVRQRAVEERRLGEHRDGGGAAPGIGARNPHRVVIGRQHAA